MGSHLEDDAPCVEENAIIRDLGIMKPIDEVTSMSAYQLFMTINKLSIVSTFIRERACHCHARR